jgi:hypothetical protein
LLTTKVQSYGTSIEYPVTFYYSLNLTLDMQVKLSGVGQRKITKYAIFDYPISVQDSHWMGKIGGYGDLMARGGGKHFLQ